MAKDLPYFKFYVSEWNDGDITMEEMHVQGVFINVCSYYWSNSCNVSIKVLRKRFRNFQNDIDYLLEEGIIKVNNDSVIIDFLCTQLCERGGLSVQNSSNAKKGWEKRRAREKAEAENDAIALDSQSEGEAKSVQYKREEKRREDKREENNSLPKLKTKTVFSEEVINLYNIVFHLFDEPSSKQTPEQVTKEANLWKDEIRKLIELDGFDSATIEHVVKVVRADDFWRGNFQTIKKLRTKNKEGIKYIDFFISKFKNGNNGSKQQIKQSIIELGLNSPEL